MSSLANALIGEYRLVEPIGAGGMGEVYKAVHTHLGRVIAIKVLSPNLADGRALQRFYNEASIQASLKHPGVAEYLGFYEYQGRPCILMEYVDGETLTMLVQRRGFLPPAEAAEIFRDIAAAAAHFHAQGVVHRDLKTSNVKITSSGQVKILDFGIARHQRSDRLTHAGSVVGTTDTLAPEQVRGEPAGLATDIWQLGVLFYELLTGHLPFQANTTHETYRRILSAEYTPIQQWQPTVPAALCRIVSHCLQKEPSRRYASAAELCEALRTWEQSPTGQRLAGQYFLRSAWAWGVTGVVLLVVMASAALWLWNGDGNHDLNSGVTVDATKDVGGTADGSLTADSAIKLITVDTVDGVAQVVQGEKQVGTTPFQVRARVGERVSLVLHRDGFEDLPVQFDVSERYFYTYTLKPQKGR